MADLVNPSYLRQLTHFRMHYSSALLYLSLFAILLVFWRNIRGRSLHELFEQDIRAHRVIQQVMANHPHGGTWQQYCRWIEDEERRQREPFRR
ncbi:MAG: hypothetical protein ACFCVA_12550 [Gammaproteobacteria bacterium]